MEEVYPRSSSALSRGRRVRPPASRLRRRTLPVTFAEIEEVDEENEGACGEQRASSVSSEAGVSSVSGDKRRRTPDIMEERLGRQFHEFRRRRARGDMLRERDAELECAPRAVSEPATLHVDPPPPS